MEEIIAVLSSKIVRLLWTLEDERKKPDTDRDDDKIRNLQVTIEALRDIRFRLEELI